MRLKDLHVHVDVLYLAGLGTACILAAILSIAPKSALGQANTGTILGTVTDSSGAVVPAAKIIVTNSNTAISRSFETDATGNYVVPYLIPGSYEVTAEKEGFRKVSHTGITLQVDQKARVNIMLTPGEVVDVISVQSEAPLVKIDSTEQAQVITAQQTVQLPLNVRNFAMLVGLSSGTVPSGSGASVGATNPQGNTSVSVNGVQGDGNNFQVDGVNDNHAFFGHVIVLPSIDAIQEFKVSTNDYAAEFGRAGGAQVQVQIKSGTNQLHGVGFGFLRDEKLDANNFFRNRAGQPRLGYDQDQFGGNIGGPIRKDRTFFFADYEGYRSRRPQTSILTVPTALQRQGIFTEVNPLTGAAQPTIYDPFTKQPFSNNTIPSNRMISAAAKAFNLLPVPNLFGANGQPLLTTNYLASNTLSVYRDMSDVRIDQNISAQDQLFGRYSFLSARLSNPPFLGAVAGGDPFLAGKTIQRAQQGVINWVHSFSPRTLNEFRFGFSRQRMDITALDANLKTSDEIGIPGINSACAGCGGLPGLVIVGLSRFGHQQFAPTFLRDTVFQFVDNVTLIRGSHTIKVGADFRRLREDLFQTQNPAGEFNFDRNLSSNNGVGGVGAASFLLGYYAAGGRAAMAETPRNRGVQAFFFGQDDIRLSDKLTLNLGLRYELFPPFSDARDRISQFDLQTGDILLGCIATSCTGGVTTDKSLIEPRVGLAYTPDRGKTSIRASFGISAFAPGLGGQIGTLNTNYPWIVQQFYTPPNLYTPGPNISTGLPSPPPVEARPGAPNGHLIAKGGGSSGLFASMWWQDPNLQMTNLYQWMFSVQRSLTPNLLVDVAYVGNAGLNRFLSIPANYPQPGDDPTGTKTLQQRRPYYNSNPDLGQFGRRFNGGRTHYDSLQIKVEKRFAKGLSFLAAYTVSKNFDAGLIFTNPDSYMQKSLAGIDTPQRLVVSYIYDLPFGRAGTYGKDWNKWVDGVLGGWQVSGITVYSSGLPFTPSITSNLDNGLANRPNRIASGQASNPTIDRWFDPTAFVASPRNVYGNTGINILRGPGFRNWDVAVMKKFHWTESRYLQFRAEFFNLPNNVNFGNPNAAIDVGNAGIITSYRGGAEPRDIQFGLKLYF